MSDYKVGDTLVYEVYGTDGYTVDLPPGQWECSCLEVIRRVTFTKVAEDAPSARIMRDFEKDGA